MLKAFIQAKEELGHHNHGLVVIVIVFRLKNDIILNAVLLFLSSYPASSKNECSMFTNLCFYVIYLEFYALIWKQENSESRE